MVHGINHSLEMVETVMGVAKVAFEAVEFKHNHLDHHDRSESEKDQQYHQAALSIEEEKEIEALRYENHRLRNILEENLKPFQNISQSPSLTKNCLTDLYKRLEAALESTQFLNQLESLHQASLNSSTNNFPFEETTEADLVTVEILVNGERSRWVWVTDEKLIEERSGIDNETYVIVSEDDVVEGVANFMAKCIISNSKTRVIKLKQSF